MSGMSGAMPGASTPVESILCPTVFVAVSTGGALGNGALIAPVLAVSALAVSTPASAIFGVAFGSLASGIGASPDGEAASWMNSCLLIGGSSMRRRLDRIAVTNWLSFCSICGGIVARLCVRRVCLAGEPHAHTARADAHIAVPERRRPGEGAGRARRHHRAAADLIRGRVRSG